MALHCCAYIYMESANSIHLSVAAHSLAAPVCSDMLALIGIFYFPHGEGGRSCLHVWRQVIMPLVPCLDAKLRREGICALLLGLVPQLRDALQQHVLAQDGVLAVLASLHAHIPVRKDRILSPQPSHQAHKASEGLCRIRTSSQL